MKSIFDLWNEADKTRFQDGLANLAMAHGAKTIVETGLGVSTVCFLYRIIHTLNMEDARVYSVDPSPWYPEPIESPQHELIRKKSVDALPELYLKTGAWDFFTHDSDHDVRCMTYELNFAFKCLKNGGIIACDDVGWNGHTAWQDFVAKEKLSTMKLGSVEWAFKKHGDAIQQDLVEAAHKSCLQEADKVESEWLAKGNKNSELFA